MHTNELVIVGLIILLILKEILMATKSDVLAAVTQLKADVQAELDKQLVLIEAQIADLQAKVMAGGAATAADLEDIVTAIKAVDVSSVAAVDTLASSDGVVGPPSTPDIPPAI